MAETLRFLHLSNHRPSETPFERIPTRYSAG